MAYQKGETGNSKGQVRAKPIRDALVGLLSRPGDDPLSDTPKTMAQRIAMDLVRDAVQAPDYDQRAEARKEVMDRTDGKAIQALEHSGHDGNPIEISDAKAALLRGLVSDAASGGTNQANP